MSHRDDSKRQYEIKNIIQNKDLNVKRLLSIISLQHYLRYVLFKITPFSSCNSKKKLSQSKLLLTVKVFEITDWKAWRVQCIISIHILGYVDKQKLNGKKSPLSYVKKDNLSF